MYDMSDEWDRYMLRYGGYSLATLGEFLDEGVATYDGETDAYTICLEDGQTITVTSMFQPR